MTQSSGSYNNQEETALAAAAPGSSGQEWCKLKALPVNVITGAILKCVTNSTINKLYKNQEETC